MTLQTDLSILLGDPLRAKSIHRILFTKGRLRQQAYDYLVEVARRAGLGVLRMSVLLLKYEDERRARIEATGPDARLPGDEAWAAREFFETVSSYGEAYRVHTRQDLLLLVAEITLLGLKDLPTDSNALAYIEQQRGVIIEQLAEADDETEARFRKLKNHWLRQTIELRSSEATLDDLAQRASSIRHDFMQLFGREFLAERAQLYRMNVAEHRLQLLKDNPGINEADIERMLGKGKSQRHPHLSRHQLGLPVYCFLSTPGNSPPADEGYAKARSLLRALATLTHPDKVRQRELNCSQRGKLEEIWHEISPLRTESNNKAVLARSVAYLESKLQFAERILELAHIEDLDVSLVIQGSTIEEQIKWLENANEFLDNRIRCLQADNLHFRNSQELDDMQMLVEAPREAQEAERKAMMEKCETFKKRADALERRADRLIGVCA